MSFCETMKACWRGREVCFGKIWAWNKSVTYMILDSWIRGQLVDFDGCSLQEGSFAMPRGVQGKRVGLSVSLKSMHVRRHCYTLDG